MVLFQNNKLPETDGTILVQKALSAVMRTNEQIDVMTVRDILIGKETEMIRKNGFNTIKTFGVGRDVSADDWLMYICQMICLDYLTINTDGLLKITDKGRKTLSGERALLVNITLSKKNTESVAHIENEDTIDNRLIDDILRLRQFISRVKKLSVNQILSYTCIETLARQKPTDVGNFRMITGAEYPNCAEYEYDFIDIFRKYEANKDIDGNQIELPDCSFEEMYDAFSNFLMFNNRMPEIKAVKEEAILRKWYDNIKSGLIPCPPNENAAIKALDRDIRKITGSQRRFRSRYIK
ncbi:MAG: hypothetical protein MJZ27_09140 [Bacteroidales bacterium]|nr:hypothetical protein [Bacteroidales bacterium]